LRFLTVLLGRLFGGNPLAIAAFMKSHSVCLIKSLLLNSKRQQFWAATPYQMGAAYRGLAFLGATALTIVRHKRGLNTR
jgi:hypothetical protein